MLIGETEVFVVVFGEEEVRVTYLHVAFHGGNIAEGIVFAGCAAQVFGIEERADISQRSQA